MSDFGIGTIIGSLINRDAQQDTNKANAAINQTNLDFQKMMSDTAHTREIADLRRNGLNPYLTSTGAGASTPGGSSISMQAPTIELPDYLAYGLSLKQLEQKEKELQLDSLRVQNETFGVSLAANKDFRDADRYGLEKNADSRANKKLMSELQTEQLNRVLARKGLPKATLGQEVDSFLLKLLQNMRGNLNNMQQRKDQNPLDRQIENMITGD